MLFQGCVCVSLLCRSSYFPCSPSCQHHAQRTRTCSKHSKTSTSSNLDHQLALVHCLLSDKFAHRRIRYIISSAAVTLTHRAASDYRKNKRNKRGMCKTHKNY
ncbi:hypothetical protein OESDEN_07459 [Oesophagostomum dentatum]|uniref:Uncharacterized protein n=1 Tax=Oesophagostomum dentatum TaxID=61180 RepID=A0A0B1TA52_OESDE|nr:hypothetical protein OESDEN_07459 [Oesophagostomum dentatum]